jgi:DNA-binding XRE family transcriptional regulator
MDIDIDEWTPERIKQLRISMNLTQESFAQKIGVTRVYVNYLEKGVRTPNKTLCILLICMEKKGTEKGGGKRGKGKRDL